MDQLLANEEARQAELENRKKELSVNADPNENVDAFLQQFSSSLNSLNSKIEQLESAASTDLNENGEIKTKFDAIFTEISEIDKSFAVSAYFLPSYDQKQCNVRISQIRQKAEIASKKVLPKPKFKFSRASNRADTRSKVAESSGTEVIKGSHCSPNGAGTVTTHEQLPHPTTSASPSKHDEEMVKQGRGLMGIYGQTLVYTNEQLAAQDFVLINIDSCTIYLLGHMPALRMLGIKNSKIYAGPVTGACFIDNVDSCKLVLATFQARIHNTTNSDFYLRIRSQPIIEHSAGVRFAPFFLTDEGVLELLAKHQLGEENGLYTKVQDFGWIKASQSPNWSIIPECERLCGVEIPIGNVT